MRLPRLSSSPRVPLVNPVLTLGGHLRDESRSRHCLPGDCRRSQGMERANTPKLHCLKPQHHHLQGTGSWELGRISVWGCQRLQGKHNTRLRSLACCGCSVFCQVVSVLIARLGSCLRSGTLSYSGTTKITTKAALNPGLGRKSRLSIGHEKQRAHQSRGQVKGMVRHQR